MDFSGNLMFPNSFTIAGGEEKGTNKIYSYSNVYLQRAETGKKWCWGGKILVGPHDLF